MENMPINKAVSSAGSVSPQTDPRDKKIDREKLKRACADFETLFTAQILKAMRQTVPQSGLLGNGPGKDIYESFIDQELSKKMSQGKGIGLGAKLYQQILKKEEKAQPDASQGGLKELSRVGENP
jgi:flagellar protein FlgJ